jgi:hypothetical protein
LKTPKQAGEAIFGRQLRADLAVWIVGLDPGRFFLSEAQEAMPSECRTGIAGELERLAAVGMLAEDQSQPGDRRRYFNRTDSDLWHVFLAARDVLPTSSAGPR